MERSMEQAVFSGKSEKWNRRLVGGQDRTMEQTVLSGESEQWNGQCLVTNQNNRTGNGTGSV